MLCCRGSSSVQKIDHRRRQSVVKTSKTHSPAAGSCATSLFLPHFDVICDLLLNRLKTTLRVESPSIFLEKYSSRFFWEDRRRLYSQGNSLQNRIHLLNNDLKLCNYNYFQNTNNIRL